MPVWNRREGRKLEDKIGLIVNAIKEKIMDEPKDPKYSEKIYSDMKQVCQDIDSVYREMMNQDS